MAILVNVASSALRTRTGAPGRQVVTTGKGIGGVSTEAEVYPSPGIFARPPKGSKVVMIPLAGGRTRVIIGAANYQIQLDCTDGETIIYSTNAAGNAVKAKIYLDALGNIELNGNSKRFVTADELQSALTGLCATLTAHVHASLGTPSPGLVGLACNITSAKTTTIKTGG